LGKQLDEGLSDLHHAVEEQARMTRTAVLWLFIVAFAVVPFVEHVVAPFVQDVVMPFFANAVCRLPNAYRVFQWCW
jgi:hypothetical protein